VALIRKKGGTTTGLLTILTVYWNGERVGRAFHVEFDGYIFEPILSDDNGGPLNADWYQLRPESQHIAVVSRSIH